MAAAKPTVVQQEQEQPSCPNDHYVMDQAVTISVLTDELKAKAETISLRGGLVTSEYADEVEAIAKTIAILAGNIWMARVEQEEQEAAA